MKNYRVLIVTVFFLTVSVIVVFRTVRPVTLDPTLQADTLALQRDQIALQREHLRRNADVWFYGAAGLMGSACLAALIVASGIHRANVKRASVHEYAIGGSKVIVHERDLGLAAPIALGLMNAEQLQQMNGGLEKAFELSCRMADVQNRQLKALIAQRPLSLPAVNEPSEMPHEPRPVPTFKALLDRGELTPGQPMILGYIHGTPRRGSFQDIYSAAVAGESGSGKTATLLYLMASGLIAEGIRFYGIDPHYPHPKSFGFKSKVLWEAGAVTMATNLDQGREVCLHIGAIIDQRLTQQDTTTTPVVLVIDELAFLMKTTLAADLARTMTRVSTEGRKCAVYMLASSQTWLVDSTGGTSVVRDTLTSAYIHRIKPRQAQLILQDRDETAKVKKYVKHAGQVLLCSVQHESAIAQIPYITEHDLQRVAAMVNPVNTAVNTPVNSQRVDGAVDQRSQHTGLVKPGVVDLVDQVNTLLQNEGDFSALCQSTRLDKAYLSRILKRKQTMSQNAAGRLRQWVENH
jgi:hypothetical protein